MARVGPDGYEDALLEFHVKEFDITGRPMTGWVLVEPEGVEDDEQLHDWVQPGAGVRRDVTGEVMAPAMTTFTAVLTEGPA